MVNKLFLLLFTTNLTIVVHGQTPVPIYLENPSFEDVPRASKPPQGWDDVNAYNETPPDTQPAAFGVTKPANDGKTYLGLVVRDNRTTEAVRQQLKTPLLKNVTYTFSLWACSSERYISQSRGTGRRNVTFNTPALIELWACNNTSESQKLGMTKPISSHEWEKFEFEFTPNNTYNYFIISAFYADNTAYNGNILVDNLLSIVPKPQIEVVPQKPQKIVSKPRKKLSRGKSIEAPLASNASFTKKFLNIPFGYDSAELPPSAFKDLDDYMDILKANPSAHALIEGFTNNQINTHDDAVLLSLKRAQAVCHYWVNKGIDRSRLEAKGLGKANLKGVKITLFIK